MAIMHSDIRDMEEIDDTLLDFGVFQNLTLTQVSVLKAVCQNMLSDEKHTDEAVAERANVCVNTVRNCRKNPAFAEALGSVMRGLVKGKVDRYIRLIETQALKDWRAAKFLLEYTGQFIPKRQHLNIYANINPQNQVGSFQDWIDEFCIKIGAAGYPIEEVLKRFHELKAEGAF